MVASGCSFGVCTVWRLHVRCYVIPETNQHSATNTYKALKHSGAPHLRGAVLHMHATAGLFTWALLTWCCPLHHQPHNACWSPADL